MVYSPHDLRKANLRATYMASYNISITSTGNPSPSSLNCSPGDKITWTNNYTKSISAFTLPSCVSPQTSPAPIAVGGTTQTYTVNSGVNGNFSYSYTFAAQIDADTRSGTIDVS